MTDAELIAKKLAAIETYVGDLRQIGRIDHLREDLREQRFIEHNLQLAVQADLDFVEDVVRNHLDDLMAYAASVRRRLGA